MVRLGLMIRGVLGFSNRTFLVRTLLVAPISSLKSSDHPIPGRPSFVGLPDSWRGVPPLLGDHLGAFAGANVVRQLLAGL